MSEGLLSCPFCGATDPQLCNSEAFDYCFECRACCMETARQPSEAKAIAAWNTRAKPTPVSGTDAVEVTQALKPFADLADYLDEHPDPRWQNPNDEFQCGDFPYSIGVGQLHAARDAFRAIQSLSTRTEELVKALRKYGKHRPDCNAARALPFEMRSGAVPCTCGFLAALASHRGEGG